MITSPRDLSSIDIANVILEEIKAITEDKNVGIGVSSMMNKFYLQEQEEVLRLVLKGLGRYDFESLEIIMLATRADTEAGRVSPLVKASANAATLYTRCPFVSFISHRDWSYTQITGADIAIACFHSMTFTGCVWNNVTSISLAMHYCDCNLMDFTGFTVRDDVYFFNNYSIDSVYGLSYENQKLFEKNGFECPVYADRQIKSQIAPLGSSEIMKAAEYFSKDKPNMANQIKNTCLSPVK